MSAGVGDLERALGALLPLDVAQIEMRRFRFKGTQVLSWPQPKVHEAGW